jgi:NAD-dependent DNA ligase
MSIDDILNKANELYREGKDSGLTDEQYDELMEKASPEFQARVGHKVERDMVSLPLTMGSMNKVKTGDEIRHWMESKGMDGDLFVTPKFDGIAILVEVNESGVPQRAFTRGDGVEGRDITGLLAGLGLFKTESKISSWNPRASFLVGEAIMDTEVFKSKYSARYKNPRNMVAGLFNKITVADAISDTKIVFYGMYNIDGNPVASKGETVNWLNVYVNNPYYGSYVPSRMVRLDGDIADPNAHVDFTSESLLNQVENLECDGTVWEYENRDICLSLGKENNSMNPAFARAYKPKSKDAHTTMVTGVRWQVSKSGRLAPVVEIEPVDIGGVTISNIYGDNAKWITDNKVGEGAIVEIIRSGDVIPRITEVIKGSESSELPAVCPCCETKLGESDTGVDIVCANSKCPDVLKSKMLHFIKIMGIDHIGPAGVDSLFDLGIQTCDALCNSNESIFLKGFGHSIGYKAMESVYKSQAQVPLEKIMHATDHFTGLGSTKLKELKKFVLAEEPFGVEDIVAIEGFSEISAGIFMEGLDKYKQTVAEMKFLSIKKEAVIKDGPMNGEVVVFTGVRDAGAEEKIKALGGEIGGGLNKKTTLLVCKDPNGTSGKLTKARNYGTKIISFEDLLKDLGDYNIATNATDQDREDSILDQLL